MSDLENFINDFFAGMPLQGPGLDKDTCLALCVLPKLTAESKILDLGCGTGRQTLCLLQNTKAHITAVDCNSKSLLQLTHQVRNSGLQQRLTILQEDILSITFRTRSFDLVWSEGAAYIKGIEENLKSWRRWLRYTGAVAFTELSWLCTNPPAEIKDYWNRQYPSMLTVSGNLDLIEKQGFKLRTALPLSAQAYTDYYEAMQIRLNEFSEYRSDPHIHAFFSDLEQEISMHQKYQQYYGYVFYTAVRV